MDIKKKPFKFWVKSFLGIVALLSILGGVFCLSAATDSAIVSDDEYSDYYDSLMEPDTYLKQHQIGYEYGTLAGDYYYWKYIEPSQKMADSVYEAINSFNKDMFSKAIANNFVVPVNPKRDLMIYKNYKQLQIKRNYLERKMDPHNRFKDTMAWIGGMFSLFLMAYILLKAVMYIDRNNSSDMTL